MALNENLPIITTGVVGLVTTIAAWSLGGRHKARNEYSDSITAGTDKIVDTSKKLLETMEAMLEQERERVNVERDHRELCESSLKEHKKLLDNLKREVEELKKND
jgi:ribosomal protein L7/L12